MILYSDLSVVIFWAVAQFNFASHTEKDMSQDNMTKAARIQAEQNGFWILSGARDFVFL
jgi:hypothetical protein